MHHGVHRVHGEFKKVGLPPQKENSPDTVHPEKGPIRYSIGPHRRMTIGIKQIHYAEMALYNFIFSVLEPSWHID